MLKPSGFFWPQVGPDRDHLLRSQLSATVRLNDKWHEFCGTAMRSVVTRSWPSYLCGLPGSAGDVMWLLNNGSRHADTGRLPSVAYR